MTDIILMVLRTYCCNDMELSVRNHSGQADDSER